jgi:hypothetical protein
VTDRSLPAASCSRALHEVPCQRGHRAAQRQQVLKIDLSTLINRPVEEVFAVVSNPEGYRRWSPRLVDVKKTTEGPVGLGTTWRLVRQVLGQRLQGDLELVEYEPNRTSPWTAKAGRFRVYRGGPSTGSVVAHGFASSSRQSQAASSGSPSRSSEASPRRRWTPSSPT